MLDPTTHPLHLDRRVLAHRHPLANQAAIRRLLVVGPHKRNHSAEALRHHSRHLDSRLIKLLPLVCLRHLRRHLEPPLRVPSVRPVDQTPSLEVWVVRATIHLLEVHSRGRAILSVEVTRPSVEVTRIPRRLLLVVISSNSRVAGAEAVVVMVVGAEAAVGVPSHRVDSLRKDSANMAMTAGFPTIPRAAMEGEEGEVLAATEEVLEAIGNSSRLTST